MSIPAPGRLLDSVVIDKDLPARVRLEALLNPHYRPSQRMLIKLIKDPDTNRRMRAEAIRLYTTQRALAQVTSEAKTRRTRTSSVEGTTASTGVEAIREA